jgi:hypothetical protein
VLPEPQNFGGAASADFRIYFTDEKYNFSALK